MFDMHGFDWGWWVVMSVGMVAFWVLAIWTILWLIRGAAAGIQPRGPSPADDPKAILQRRLAQGDISIEDYQQLIAALDYRRHQPPGAGTAVPPQMVNKRSD